MMNHPKRLHPRRYVFIGHAIGVSAHIRRPEDHVLPVQGSSAIPETGGRSENNVGPKSLGKWVSFDSVTTSVHGDYVSAAEAVAMTRGELPFDGGPAETRVSARVRGLSILGRVNIADLSLGLVSRSAEGKAQPSTRLEGNRIEGVTIDGARLKIHLAEDFFCRHHTLDLVRCAFQGGLGPDEHRMFLPCNLPGEEEEVHAFPEADGMVKCSIVDHLSWDGEEHKTAKICGHVVAVPGLGKIYFGEMYVKPYSRRLSLVRFQLGSDDGGDANGGTGESGTSTFPPGS
jgi:hypothetical protein